MDPWGREVARPSLGSKLYPSLAIQRKRNPSLFCQSGFSKKQTPRHQAFFFFFLIENARIKTGRARTGCENSQPSIQVSPGMECRGGLWGGCPRPPSDLGKVPQSPQRILWWQSAEQCAPPLPGSCVAAAMLPSVTGGTALLSPVRA